ncbi:hypothetical protein LCGC14_1353050 [marine sediment metagenome]|uniref:Uncharacterized protein n=1 Tax=marine sediment metagenome TaxID=412755 RepID=A0A0F9KWF3_9ZZZZ
MTNRLALHMDTHVPGKPSGPRRVAAGAVFAGVGSALRVRLCVPLSWLQPLEDVKMMLRTKVL